MDSGAQSSEVKPPEPLTRHSPPNRLWHWLIPSATQWLGVVILLILLSQPWRTAMVASDGDACMHWRIGEWMLQRRQIIRVDEFSHTRYGEPVIAKEWLAQLLYAVAGRLGGLYGLCVLAALIIAGTFALLHRQLLRDGNDLVVSTAVTIVAAWAACTHWLARPHVFSFLMVLLWHQALRRHERQGDTLRLALTLTVLTVLWVNMHGGFLAGFLVLGACWAGAGLDWARARQEGSRGRFLRLSGVALLCAAASLLNPNGYRLHAHNIEFLRSSYLTNWLAEYSSTNFQSPTALGFLALLALIFLTLALARPRFSVAEMLVLISWTYFALYAGRNIPLLAILSAPILASAWTHQLRPSMRQISERLAATSQAGRGGALIVIAAAVLILAVPRPTQMPEDRWPAHAVAFIKQHPEQFSGNMFNQYVWGGYLMHALPEHKTFVDGRTDFFGEPLIRDFDEITDLRPRWYEQLKEYQVDWTLLPVDDRLNLALALMADWRLIYSNHVAAIYRRNP